MKIGMENRIDRMKNRRCQINKATNHQISPKKIVKIVKGVHGNRKKNRQDFFYHL